MPSKKKAHSPDSPDIDRKSLEEALGYLNFSSGKPAPAFQRTFNVVHTAFGIDRPVEELRDLLLGVLEELHTNSPAFADVTQADAVIRLALDDCLSAYRAHHRDLLFHLSDEYFRQPLFVVRVLEAVLQQGGPWNDRQRIVDDVLDRLNDFVGFRPLALLEDGRQMQVFPHERFRPIPLYIREADVAGGKYYDVVSRTLNILREVPADIAAQAHFESELLDELSLDVRAHDHLHPVNKRTNYMFGEWDPHHIDNAGHYRRFVIRQIILDSLLAWIDIGKKSERNDRLDDAACVLGGTILMASAISGSGPDTHDSGVTLTSLLQKVAQQRDAFYDNLLQSASGKRATRLARTTKLTHQPFGHVRQFLNIELARYGARQVQYRHLAHLYARMGFLEASRQQAAVIPSPSVRFETELGWRLTAAHRHLDAAEASQAFTLLAEIEEQLGRGIECGAMIDPWNILGFQAQFPLFSSREDSVPDHRAETLVDFMNRIFEVYSRGWNEAIISNDSELTERYATGFRNLAEWWDRFATPVVEELPAVVGMENWETTHQVSAVLGEWRTAGESAGDIAFWRQHTHRFESADAFGQIVATLIQKRDDVAAMGLLMQWLSEVESVGLDAGSHSMLDLLEQWMALLVGNGSEQIDFENVWPKIRRLFAYLEANAGRFWQAPSLEEAAGDLPAAVEEPAHDREPEAEEPPDEDSLFDAAYESMVYRDSAADGVFEDTMDGDYATGNTELDAVARALEPRLSFLQTLARLWQVTGAVQAAHSVAGTSSEPSPDDAERHEDVRSWQAHLDHTEQQLSRLLNQVWEYRIPAPSGEHDSNIEYDMQLQTRYYLLHAIVATHTSVRKASRCLAACLPSSAVSADQSSDDRQVVDLYRAVFRRDVPKARKVLPELLRRYSKIPLLYVPMESGGRPDVVCSTRDVQSDFEFMLSQLPRMGMLHETWHVLRTAFRMERSSRPGSLAVTEFDRLFQSALENTLECVVDSSVKWKSGRFSDDELIDVVTEIVGRYERLWVKHSESMRLSIVEDLNHESIWRRTRTFIERYGGDFLQVRMLTLGNVRTVLNIGIDRFLDTLAESSDPLNPVKLLEDIESGRIKRPDAVRMLKLIYESVVDRFERFAEYNTTTTQSDYGEQFYSLLDFLRLEVSYERDAWNLAPMVGAHEVLVARDRTDAAEIWEHGLRNETATIADEHQSRLRELEQRYGMRLPSLADRLNERFIKPLAVNRMLAAIPAAMEESRNAEQTSPAFARLRQEIDDYLDTTSGSGVDIPPWLYAVEKEVERVAMAQQNRGEADFYKLEPRLINLREMRRQLRVWNERLWTRRRGD